MLNLRLKSFLTSTFLAIKYNQIYRFSNYSVKEVRGNYLYVVQDKQRQLDYMREIETEDGRKGIVLKIEQPSSTYIAMYEIIPNEIQEQFKLKKKGIFWQQSVKKMQQIIINSKSKSIFNVNGQTIYNSNQTYKQSSVKVQRRKLLSLEPILDLCEELSYGQMYNFTGCMGSRKTTTLKNIFNNFNKYQKHVSLYFNPTSHHQVQKILQQSGTWGFNGNIKKQQQTDVGVYMLAIKTIYLAKLLSKDGWNVLLGIDNFKNLLQAEWHMLQLLTNIQKKNNSFINYNSPKISPISLLNEIYANCNDFQLGKSKKSGSFTSVVLTEDTAKPEELMPQITPFTNNLKHLASLAHKIIFPLNIKLNHKTNLHHVLDKESIDYNIRFIRQHINNYLREKQQSDLKRKLYKTDIRDAPWDYYQILDCQWWLQGLQNTKIKDQLQFNQYLQWIRWNIEYELVAHWKIKCNDGFKLYQQFSNNDQINHGENTLQNFIGWAKLQGHYSAFKKDYLN